MSNSENPRTDTPPEQPNSRQPGSEERTGLELAIVGMAGRFPGADDLETFWSNLKQGVETLTFFTETELEARGADLRQLRAPGYVKAARELNRSEWFDAGFFGISPREAEVIDPQQRVFLESSWHALEDAGYDTERFPGVVGVYAGARMPGYLNNLYSNPALVAEVSDFTVQVANDKDYVATRVSYKLDLGGPSITVQTACSTALVAVHLAGQGLLSGDCDIALAGGVGIRIPEVGFVHTEGQIYSPDGHIRTFDAKARGTMFSSGVGVVVLKRLDDALAAGDAIRAIIRGSAVTNDAAQKVGFTAPGVDGQTRVVRAAMLTAEVHPETMGYVEAHGTGTQMGDPIEVTALSRVYREQTQKKNFCALGSVKTNIGHLGAAAGAASLIKTVLALEHKEIPPSLLFDEPNPECHLPESPFYVNTEHRPWEVADGVPRRAGISAFGVGGTNAHVVVEEAPVRPPSGPSRPRQLLVLSARSQEALEQMTGSLASYLDAHRELPLADVAYTLAIGRRPFDVRRAVVALSHEDAVRALRALDRDSSATAVVNGKNRPVTFLFSGQGAQYPNMGRNLYESEPVFRAEIDRACELLLPHLGFDLRQVLYPEGATEEAEKKLAETHVTQPALFVIEHALARLWMSWGIEPESMIGHSIGEYVAATVAGVFTLAEALKLVAARGRLMHGLPRGSMVGVPLTEEELAAVLPEGLSIATLNAPNRLVASGPDSGIEELERRLKEKGVAASRLRTSHAFHSPMMEPILAPFLQEFAGIELQAPKIPYVSNVTGTWITAAEATDPAYWARHLRQAVRFSDGLAELLKEPARCLLEVGPGKTLATFARQHPARAKEQPALSSLRHPKDKLNDLAFALRSLGELWAAGVGVDLAKLYRREKRRRVSLPGYAFERQRYWVEPGDLSALAGPKVAKKKEDIADWFYAPYWKPSGPPALPAAWAQGEETGAAADAGAVPDAEAASWLVFADGRGLADQVVTRLRGLGHAVATVVPGEIFAKLGSGAYTLAPGGPKDYDALLADLAVDGGVPPRVLHLWNVTEALSELTPEALSAAEARSFWSLFFFAQAVGKAGARQPIAIGVVSNNLHRVHGESYLAPEKAMLQGPAKVIPQEYPNLRVVAIDLALPASGAVEDAVLVDRLLAEMAEVPVVAPIVAWRGEDRWVRAYEPVKLAPVQFAPGGPFGLHLKEKGVYLITGGLGGIGLTFAEFLARDFQARLVPMGFSALPERSAWEAWIDKHGERDRISRRLLKLKELEAMGAEVEVVTADVGDEAQVRAAVDRAVARFGRIDGVIHAAGVGGRGLLQLKSPETAATVLAPKLRGTLMLERALAGQKLDFFVLCSSTIALAGGLGQVDYCAANSFLDAYAQSRAGANGTRVISINWGAWGEVGMAVDAGLIPGGAAAPAAGSPAAGSPAIVLPLHPLLDRSTFETAAEAIYVTDFSTDRHWVAAEHRVLGTPTVPGTTYLEIARAAYAHHAAVFEQHGGLGGVELRDVFFLGPLMLAEGESKEVRTTLEKQGNSFNFRVASKGPPKTAGAEATWAAHVRGKVGPAPTGEEAPRFDIAELLARCADQVVEFNEPVMMGEGGVVRWGPRWQSLKRVHIGAAGQGEALAVLELPAEFAAEAGSFGLHPALVDVATGILGFIEEGNFLPLSYKRLEVRKPLPAKIYSYLRRQGEPGGGKETLSVDVSLLDESGEELVRIDHFTLKRVGEAVDTLRRSAEATGRPAAAPAGVEAAVQPARPAPAPAPDAGFDPDAGGGILPHEGVEALRRVLAKDHNFAQLATTSKDLAALFEQVNSMTRASLAGRGDGAQVKRASHARPSLSTAYMAPRNPVEEKLAEIWKGSLGIEQIGVHDNFFDLGGDSVMGIQLVARANDAGLELSPEQLFEHQTIAELAVMVAPMESLAETAAEPETKLDAESLADVGLKSEEMDEVFAQLGEGR